MSTRRILGAAAVAALAVPLAAATPVAAAPPPPSVTGADARSSSVDTVADGRRVAEALLFASGPDAARVAALPSFAPAVAVLEQQRQDPSAVTGLLDAMSAYDPTLFAVVGSEIRSGDPYRVEAALLRLTDAVRGAVAAAGASWDDAAGLDVVPPQRVVVVAAPLAVAVTVVGVAAVVAAANALWTVNWAFAADDGDRPTQVVAEVTEAFAS